MSDSFGASPREYKKKKSNHNFSFFLVKKQLAWLTFVGRLTILLQRFFQYFIVFFAVTPCCKNTSFAQMDTSNVFVSEGKEQKNKFSISSQPTTKTITVKIPRYQDHFVMVPNNLNKQIILLLQLQRFVLFQIVSHQLFHQLGEAPASLPALRQNVPTMVLTYHFKKTDKLDHKS